MDGKGDQGGAFVGDAHPQVDAIAAGDIDGDGIVDSGLKKLPIGDINGLTYFYACRIIDNGSAININTAWSRDHEFLGNGSFAFYGNGGGVASTMPQAANFFTTNIGVAEMLRSYNSATATSLDTMQGYGATLTELGDFSILASGTDPAR
jgi:hypothetical protein